MIPEAQALSPSLDSEILLEEHRNEKGELLGVITVTAEALTKILAMRDNPMLRPDEEVEFKGGRRKTRNLTTNEFDEITGYAKYLKGWREEGIEI